MNEKLNVKEVEQIRDEYVEHGQTKFDELKKLDRKAKMPSEIFAYTFGTAGALVLGTGMCLAMKVIGASLPMAVGVVIGVAGIAMVSLNYLFYKLILKRSKAKYAKQILDLSGEVLNESAE